MRRNQLLVLVLLTAMLVPTSAAADGAGALDDCIYDGELDGQYSTEELRDAKTLAESRADIAEYYDCQEVLERAVLDAAGKRSSGRREGGPSGTGEPGGSRRNAMPTRQPGVEPPAAPPQGATHQPRQPSLVPTAPTPEDLAMLNRAQNSPPSALANLETAGVSGLPWQAFLLGVGLPIVAMLAIDAVLTRRRKPIEG